MDADCGCGQGAECQYDDLPRTTGVDLDFAELTALDGFGSPESYIVLGSMEALGALAALLLEAEKERMRSIPEREKGLLLWLGPDGARTTTPYGSSGRASGSPVASRLIGTT